MENGGDGVEDDRGQRRRRRFDEGAVEDLKGRDVANTRPFAQRRRNDEIGQLENGTGREGHWPDFVESAGRQRRDEKDQIPQRLLRFHLLGCVFHFGPQHKFGEESVALATAEVVEERLRHVGRVFQKAKDGGQHLDHLQRKQIARGLLHILHTKRHASLVCI